MLFKKNIIYIGLLFVFLAFFGILNSQNNIGFLLAVPIYILVGFFVNKKSSLHMMYFVGYTTFIFVAALLNWYYLNIDLEVFFITSVVSVFFLHITKNTTVKEFVDYGSKINISFYLFCFISVILVLVGFGSLVSPLITSLIVLLSMTFIQGNFKNNTVHFLLLAVTVLFYIYFYWSGFGRTVLFGWIILAFLQWAYSLNININKYIFGIAPALLASLMNTRDILKLDFKGFEAALYDSSYGPYRLSSTFIQHFRLQGFDFKGYWDQIVYTFFIYIPRSIWPSKPNGFGFEYTVRHLGQSLIDSGHSIAATLIGLHIYFLGYLGIVTALIIFSIFAWIANILYKLKGLNGNGVLIFSSSMMVLVWGGMNSFSARIALPTIFFIVLYIFTRRFLVKRVKFLDEK